MNVVDCSRATRRPLNRTLLGQAVLALLVTVSACTPARSSRTEPKTELPTALSDGEPRGKDENAPSKPVAEVAQPDAENAASGQTVPPAATVAPSPVTRVTPAAKAAAPSFGAGGLGLSGIGEGGAGRGVAHGSAAVAGRVLRTRAPQQAQSFGSSGLTQTEEPNTENYAHVTENKFLNVADQPLSTFSIDVDTASYSNARRFLTDGSLPPKDSIRVEEWLNYFGYDYPEPAANEPFSVTSEVSACPWNAAHRLVRLGLKSQQISQAAAPARNLVFLVDVSGSMMPENKLPLLKRGLALLADNLRPQDTISIVVYAGASGLALPATSGSERGRVLDALGRLEAGGSTNGADGIRLAYQTARQHFKQGGINRVILATDGDFNVGTSSEGELQRLIEEERKSGVFLTVLGFGEGNVKDSTMEMLADKGNGNYAYIDSLAEARKVLVREAGSTLITVAKDVKLQVEFNPTRVASYKLIGYENRLLAKEDFNDDKKDAGELGAGHAVTALYEVVPKGAQTTPPQVDPLKYQTAPGVAPAAASNELLTVNIRYKQPNSDVSTKFSRVVVDGGLPLAQSSADFRFSAAVAEAALVLRSAPDLPGASLEAARTLAGGALGQDVTGDRHEFVSLLTKARALAPSVVVVAQRP